MAKDNRNLVVGLDIGTHKCMAVVAELDDQGALRLIGLGVSDCQGMRRGIIADLDATVQSVQAALKEAEQTSACRITRVHAGITGAHIRCQNTAGVVVVKDREVTPAEVVRVIDTAKSVQLSTDQRLLLVDPQEFILDSQVVKDPVGMSGSRLEARVHVVTGAQGVAENMVKAIRRCGLEVAQLMLNPLASAQAVLTPDERELGVVMVDIGAGTTDMAVFVAGAIRHTAVIPVGGALITSDIAMALHTPMQSAEDLKLQSGCARQSMVDPSQLIDVPGLGDRPAGQISRKALAGVIEPRVEELFMLVRQVLRESGLENHVTSGVVLTGGSAQMPGMVELAEDVFRLPVRLGVPHYGGPLSDMVAHPRAATVMGMLEEIRELRLRQERVTPKPGMIRSMMGRVSDWVQGHF